MARQDLLTLTDDDLIALTNRGTVKRARKELERDRPSGTLEESEDGTVTASWSDGVISILPGGVPITEGTCTSAAGIAGRTAVTRAMVRTVLLYRLQAEPELEEVPTPWNPGQIDDRALTAIFGKATMTRERRGFEAEEVVELAQGLKPIARFFLRPCFVRFMVPDDPRYARCSCGREPCPSVARAVWAFRRLEGDAGLVSISGQPEPLDEALLAEIESAIDDLCELGMAGASRPFGDALGRLAARCQRAELAWPAEILTDLLAEHERYSAGDGRFEAGRIPELVAELLIRLDALVSRRAGRGAHHIPEVFIRGGRSDRRGRLPKARFVGLGCAARPSQGRVELTAYLQETATGDVVALRRQFVDPEDGEPKDFHQLAATPLRRGLSLSDAAAGELIARGVQLSAGRHLTLGRAEAVAHPQRFDWEQLREPLTADGFAEIGQRLSHRPPRSLRPRRVAENLFVCQLAEVVEVEFSTLDQAVVAALVDPHGERALLRFPYTHRGREGTERLLRLLTGPDPARWIAGFFQLRHGERIVEPLSLVFEGENGPFLAQPWIDPPEGPVETAEQRGQDNVESFGDPLAIYLEDLSAALAELWLQGLARTGAEASRQWQHLDHRGRELGAQRLGAPVGILARELASRRHRSVAPKLEPALAAAKELAVKLEITREILGSD